MTALYKEIGEGLTSAASGSSSDFGEETSSAYSYEQTGATTFTGDWMPLDSKVSMENFALIRVLGKGAYGKVFLVRKIGGHDSGKIYAMKVLKKTRLTIKQKTVEHTMSERKILERLKCLPFLANMVYAFQTDSKLHIVLEFIGGGELFTHLCQKKRFELLTARFIIAEIVAALENIHERKIIYRDLKLENILLNEDGHVVLTDFGLSKLYDEDDEISTTYSYCGTIEYMAPEMVKRTGHDERVDWWSLGVISFEIMTGCSPFTVDGSQNSNQDVAKRILSKSVPYPSWMDDLSKMFIDGLLNKDPDHRLGARGVNEIKHHEFFQGLDWDLLTQEKIAPPIKPKIASSIDVHNFAPEFTNLPPVFSPADPPTSKYREIFRGYSFISPSVIFSNDNVIGDEFFSENVEMLRKNSPFFAKYDMDMTSNGFLGRGTFSVCRRCKRLSDGREYAVKIVSQRFVYHAVREIRILTMLNPHENIVTLVDAISDPLHYYIVLELLKGGELLQTLRKMVKFTEFQAAQIMSQLVHAVSHIHANGIVHRDLKPENILFVDTSENVRIRLVDFGFARVLPNTKEDSLVTPCCGTLFYAAPEVLELQDELPQYNQQCDLWSLGVILFTMLSGKIPFRVRNHTETAADVISRIRRAEFSFNDPVWESVNEQAKDLIAGLLTVDPKKRLSLRQLAHHSWLTSTGINSSCELQTPNALVSTADETFNETINAFISAQRNGFHLMDVDTAPLLVKRRGMKRRLEKDSNCKTETNKSMFGGLQPVLENAELQSVLEGGNSTAAFSGSPCINNGDNCSESSHTRPNKLTFKVNKLSPFPKSTKTVNDNCDEEKQQYVDADETEAASVTGPNGTPISTAFTEYRDKRPSYLKYSRDDFEEFGCLNQKNVSKSN